MAKKIISKDVIDEGIFSGAANDAEKLLAVIKQITKETKDFAKVLSVELKENKLVTAKDVKNLDEVEKKAKQTTKTLDELSKIEKELQKQRIADLKLAVEKDKQSAKNIKNEAVNSVLEKDRIARLKALAILEDKRIGTERKLLAQNTLLRLERAKLVETDRGYEANLKRINTQIDANNNKIKANSDQLKQQKLNVGNYTQSIKDAIAQSGLFGGISAKLGATFTQLKGIFGGTGAAIKDTIAKFKEKKKALDASAEGAGLYRKSLIGVQIATQGLTTATKLLGIALKATGIGLLVGVLGSLTVAFTKTQKGADDLSVVMEGLKFAFDEIIGAIGGVGLGIATIFKGIFNSVSAGIKNIKLFGLELRRTFTFDAEKVSEIDKEIQQLNSDLLKLSKEKGIKDGFNEIGEAISGIGTKVSEAFEEGEKLGRLIVKFRDENLKLREELTVTDTELALANQRASDITLSFQKRLEATNEAANLQIKVSAAQVKIAKNNLEIAQAELDAAQKAGVKDVELREKRVAAIEALDRAESALLVAQANRETQRRQTLEKALINELLILEKQFDKISKFSEDEINSSENNVAKRQKLLRELEKTSSEIFEEEIKRIEESTKIQVDQNELINESNAAVLQEKIRALGLSEQGEKLLSKAILARQKQLLQETLLTTNVNKQIEKNNQLRKENADALRDLDTESILIDLEKQIALQKELLEGASGSSLKRLTEELNETTKDQFALRAKLLKDNAEDERRKAEETIIEEEIKAQEILKINAKLANDLKRLENEKQKVIDDNNKKTLEDLKKQKEEVIKTLGEISDSTFNEINRRKEARIRELEEEINARSQNVQRQEELAAKGINNTLEFEKQKQAEAELERKRLADEQERRQKRQVFFKAVIAGLENAKSTEEALAAVGRATAITAVADTIANAFASAGGRKDGEENIQGPGTERSDSIPMWLSKGESVVTAKGTKNYEGLATAMNNNEVDKWVMKNYGGQQTAEAYNPQLLVALKNVERAIKEKESVNINWNGHDTRVETLVRMGYKKTVKHVKGKPRI
jgi:hypothetical protein